MERDRLEKIGKAIIDAAYNVHSCLGPGLLESTYEVCLLTELVERGLSVERQKKLPVIYKGCKIDEGYRIDLLVEDEVIIELKTVEYVLPVHEAQIISYLKLSGKKLGYLINFNSALIKNGIKRKVNNI